MVVLVLVETWYVVAHPTTSNCLTINTGDYMKDDKASWTALNILKVFALGAHKVGFVIADGVTTVLTIHSSVRPYLPLLDRFCACQHSYKIQDCDILL